MVSSPLQAIGSFVLHLGQPCIFFILKSCNCVVFNVHNHCCLEQIGKNVLALDNLTFNWHLVIDQLI